MKIRLVPRGNMGLRVDLVLDEDWRGLKAGQELGQIYLNDQEKTRAKNPDREAFADLIVKQLGEA